MKNNQLGGQLAGFQAPQNKYNAFTSPGFITAISGLNPGLGKILQAGALEAREADKNRLHQQEFEMKQQEFLQKQKVEEALAQGLGDIDFSDPNKALQQLQAKGLPADIALPLIGKFQGFANDKEQLAISKGHLGVAQEGLGLSRQKNAFELKALEAKLANGGLEPEEEAKLSEGLRKEVAAESKDFKLVKSAFEKLKESAKNPSPANDVTTLFAFMKMNDPNSVVREGEYATAENAGSIPTRIQNQYNKALNGEKLTPQQRTDFVKSATGIYRSQAKTNKEVTSKYKELAKRQKVNPENVVLFEPQEEVEEIQTPTSQGLSQAEQAKAILERRRAGK